MIQQSPEQPVVGLEPHVGSSIEPRDTFHRPQVLTGGLNRANSWPIPT